MAAIQARIRWTARHYKLRRQLERFKWSLQELHWLQTHIQYDVPPELEALIAAKIRDAEAGERA